MECLADLINIPGERYEYETNMLFYFTKNKIDIVEEDIKTIYIDKNKNSNFKKIKDSIRVYRTIKSGMWKVLLFLSKKIKKYLKFFEKTIAFYKNLY